MQVHIFKKGVLFLATILEKKLPGGFLCQIAIANSNVSFFLSHGFLCELNPVETIAGEKFDGLLDEPGEKEFWMRFFNDQKETVYFRHLKELEKRGFQSFDPKNPRFKFQIVKDIDLSDLQEMLQSFLFLEKYIPDIAMVKKNHFCGPILPSQIADYFRLLDHEALLLGKQYQEKFKSLLDLLEITQEFGYVLVCN